MRNLLAAFALLLSTPAMALAGDPYTVLDVRIDATAGNALEAQTAAMRQGQLDAARRLVERMTLAEDRAGTVFALEPYFNEMGEMVNETELDAALVSEMISGLEIQDEQRSATRYLASLNVSFDPATVERILDSYGVPFVETQARPTLILPVYDGETGFQLWENNPWRQAWLASSFENALTPMFAPGDTQGAPYLSARQALSLDEAGLQQVASIYGVNRIAVLRAQERDGIRRFGGYLIELDGLDGPVIESWGPATVIGGWSNAAMDFMLDRERVWKEQSVVRDGEIREVRVTVLYSGIEEWRGLQSMLTGASLIENARLDALSRDGALMTVNYRGEREQLVTELAERGAVLEEHPGLGWVVRRAF
ncbi:MAG: DUF2066 domain-containing protein [Alphaproteobacteria bacterium]|nr:DUF2066 domain-containing protein [Alphaproteobacteria bacterium]